MSPALPAVTFHAIVSPAAYQLAAMSKTAPANPFLTPQYLRAKQAAGSGELFLLELRRNGVLIAGTAAFLHSGRLSAALEIESAPSPTLGSDSFWRGVLDFCRQQRARRLIVGTYASEPGALPRTVRMTQRSRIEHVLDLSCSDLFSKLSPAHRRNVKRARSAGIVARSSTSAVAVDAHVAMMAASMDRRKDRGESVAAIDERTASTLAHLIETGAAEIFQAFDEDRVLSSLLLLLSEKGAYYHSAGTSSEGMGYGASQFLVHDTAVQLQQRGLQQFNLGGASASEEGLFRFKSAFGGDQVQLEEVTLDRESVAAKAVRSVIRTVRDILSGFEPASLGAPPSNT